LSFHGVNITAPVLQVLQLHTKARQGPMSPTAWLCTAMCILQFGTQATSAATVQHLQQQQQQQKMYMHCQGLDTRWDMQPIKHHACDLVAF